MPIGQHLAHLSQEIKSYRYSRSTYNTTTSLAQHLPDELILGVLTHLSYESLLAQHAYPVFRLSDPSRISHAEDAALCQQALYSAALLCRSWHPVGTELLYHTPFLSTKRSVHLLLRTLTSTPCLARFVSNLYAPLVTNRSPLDWLRMCLNIKTTSSVEINEVRDIVAKLSQNMSLLHMLTLKHLVPSGHISTIPLSAVPIPPHLEHLCIRGTSFESHSHPQFCLLPSHSEHSSLESLKALCLRDMYILPTVKLPRMPRIERVALVQNHYFQSMTDAPDGPSLLNSADVPALRSFEMYGYALPFATTANATPSLQYLLDAAAVRKLEAFTLVQAIGHLTESLQLVSKAFTAEGARLRSLTVGVVGLVDCASLEKWTMPRSLDQLTLLLCTVPLHLEKRVMAQSLSRDKSDLAYSAENERPLRSVCRCLQYNNAQMSGIRELVLVVSPLDAITSYEVEQLEQCCSAQNIDLRIVSQELDRCISERLIAVETTGTTSTSPLMPLARVRSSEVKRPDIQHLDF